MNITRVLCTLLLVTASFVHGDAIRQTKGDHYDAFRQLDVDLPTPNSYRNASGAPGHAYWQQRADYVIEVSLDEEKKRITGSETITYTNNSPDTLRYIWLQLDQNRNRKDSIGNVTGTADKSDGAYRLSYRGLAWDQYTEDHTHGFELSRVVGADGIELVYTIVDTMMRIDLPEPLVPGGSHSFSIDWAFNVVDDQYIWARNGYDYFVDTDTYIYYIAQWFPRLVSYTDYAGWQHKQFLGGGEFTLEFGDYEVAITVPEDHIVSASGALQNPEETMSSEQLERLDEARSSDKPVFLVTAEEALENEKEKAEGTKTWKFKADNVRDFAWASSRKFIWDAMVHQQDDPEVPEVLAMSFYPNEAMPIWAMYSTEAVVHTMEVYSRFSFNYPYPTAQSVNTWKSGGMEYPMITFNGYRPDPYESKGKEDEETDDSEEAGDEEVSESEDPESTYSRMTKAGLISVIIHEIGHIYFPMTVNSDERQWTWMDEGINTFLQRTAEFEWEENFPQWGNSPLLDRITNYMTSDYQVPIMTQSDSILQFGNNAYAKPAAALTVLRETVMGRELFDFAFREYAQRWKFKRPTPADFFRTMEDASGVDLDWFWRGWFYSTDHVDVAISSVSEYKISTFDPDVETEFEKETHAMDHPEPLTQIRNREEGKETRVARNPDLEDFYNEHDPFTVTDKQRNDYSSKLEGLEDWERETLERAIEEDKFIYFVEFKNLGGLPTPLPILFTNEDDTTELVMIPAEIWRRNIKSVSKLFIREKAVKKIVLDPHHEIADADHSNNQFPPTMRSSRLELYKRDNDRRDLMAEMLVKLKPAKSGEEGEDSKDVPLETVEE